FFVLGAIGVVFALPYSFFLRGVNGDAPAEPKSTGMALTFPVLVRVRTFRLLCIVFPVFVFGLWLLYGWLPAFLHDKFSLKPSDAAFHATVFLQSVTLLRIDFPVFVFGLWLLYGWLPAFLHDKFSLNQSDAAFNATVFLQGATLLGLLGGGVLADKMYRRTKATRLWLMVASLLLCAPCL